MKRALHHSGDAPMEELRHLVFGESSLLFDCYPGGNDTYIFCNRKIARPSYDRAQGLIRSRFPHFEQGGFIERARSHQAVARIQTVGGDFSPNTARSAVALLAELFCKDKSALPFARWSCVTVSRETLFVPIEVAGSREILQAAVWASANEWQVELEFMRTAGLRIERRVPLQLDGQECCCDVVMRGGLAQVLISEEEASRATHQLAVYRNIVGIRDQLGLQSHPLVGVAWWKRRGEKLSIRPVSYLSGIDTCFKETASGAAAVALALLLHDGRSRAACRVVQPSGVELRVRIQPGITGSCPSRVFLIGPVKVRGELNSSFQGGQQDAFGGLRLIR